MNEKIVQEFVTHTGKVIPLLEVPMDDEVNFLHDESQAYYDDDCSFDDRSDNEARSSPDSSDLSGNGEKICQDPNTTEDDDCNTLRLSLPEHVYFKKSRLTALDQCKFLECCLNRQPWQARGGWNLVRKDLNCSSSSDALKKLLGKYLKLYKQNQLQSLRGSGLDEEKCLRKLLLEEIDQLMSDAIFEKKEADSVDQSTPTSTENSEVWSAKRVRDNAVQTLKNKTSPLMCDVPSPPGTNGGRKTRILDIAKSIRDKEEIAQSKQFELQTKKLDLERERLELDRKKEERQDKLVAAQIEAMQANTTLLITLCQSFNKK